MKKISKRETNARNIDITDIPLLIPCEENERDGYAHVGDEFQAVRELTDDDLDSKSPSGTRFVGTISARDWKFIRIVVSLRRALEKEDDSVVDAALKGLDEILNEPKSPNTVLLRSDVTRVFNKHPLQPAVLLLQAVSDALRDAKLVFWQPEGRRFGLAIFCSRHATAVLTRALTQQRGLRFCPKCGRIFIPHPPQQDYCKPQCGNAYRTARSRSKKKAENLNSWQMFGAPHFASIKKPSRTSADVTEAIRNWIKSSRKRRRTG